MKHHRTHHRLKGRERLLLLIIVALILLIYGFFQNRDKPRDGTPTEGNIAVHFIDVAQGDASLILTDSGEVMLIDTGDTKTKEALVAYIQNLGIESIDYLVLTHPHADHIGGAVAVLEAFTVKEVLMPDAITDTRIYENVLLAIEEESCTLTIPSPADTLSLGTARITILGPVKEYKNDLNAMSLVLRLDYGTTSFLFTGDAEARSEEDMLAQFSPSEFDVDVLKLGHHGSSTSSCAAFLDAVSATYAIASCGEGNDYGHPHREILTAMTERGIALYRTDRDGSIVFLSDGSSLSVSFP